MKDLTGKIFNRLTVLSYAFSVNKKACWLCKCICGTEKYITSACLITGRTKSCGCYKSELLIERNKKTKNK